MDTPTKAFMSVGFVGGLLIAAGGADAINKYNEDNFLASEAARTPAVMNTVKASMIAHAQGVQSGLIINGIAVPESLSEKISELATMDLSRQIEAAMDMRHAGMEEVMEGAWDIARLDAYVERIAQFEPAVDALMLDAMAEASKLGLNDESMASLVKLHMASALVETDDHVTRTLAGSDDPFAKIMGRMRQGIQEELGGIEAISQINRVVMTELAMEAFSDGRGDHPAPRENDVEMSL